MALSSDELVKREIADYIKDGPSGVKLRIFPQSSRDDRNLFSKGGLTFGHDGIAYGSCDAAWVTKSEWVDPYDGSVSKESPLIALEATDALNRGSSGNAQYQRFHHVLGASRSGVTGIYYFRPGISKIQEDLYGMAVRASATESGKYIVTDSLEIVREIVMNLNDSSALEQVLAREVLKMEDKFQTKFQATYKGDWDVFAEKRSTIVFSDYVLKHAGRMARNFTDSSQRAGHIALGEMFLTKYFYPEKRLIYLFPKMLGSEKLTLDKNKKTDKEWHLLRHEPGVKIATIDDLMGVSKVTTSLLLNIKDIPIHKGPAKQTYNKCIREIVEGLKAGSISVKNDIN